MIYWVEIRRRSRWRRVESYTVEANAEAAAAFYRSQGHMAARVVRG